MNNLLDKLLDNNYNDLRQIIDKILLELGIPSNLKGYTYIEEAIFLCVKDSNYKEYITKRLYPALAEKLNVKEYQVEKNIRKAIEVSWTNANPETLEKIFGYSIGLDRDRPTNFNYIITISNILVNY